jgi:hypothetical protein
LYRACLGEDTGPCLSGGWEISGCPAWSAEGQAFAGHDAAAEPLGPPFPVAVIASIARGLTGMVEDTAQEHARTDSPTGSSALGNPGAAVTSCRNDGG